MIRRRVAKPATRHSADSHKGKNPVSSPTIVYQGPKFHVERHDVRDRQGDPRRYDLVVHPGAAVVLPLLDDGRVLLIQNYRFAIGRDLLELPAGTIDPPESPEECARRELAEETGYHAAELRLLLSFYSTPGICSEHMHAFVATQLTQGQADRDPGERIQNTPMEYTEALRAIGDGRITDAKTIVALLYYDHYVREPR